MDSNIDNLFNDLNRNKKTETVLTIIVILLVVGVIGVGVYFYMNRDKNNNVEIDANDNKNYSSEYRMEDNNLGEFDLAFLKLENDGVNKVYSPLAIKYALAMLNDGTGGDSNGQIKAVIGDYKAKRYTNSNNLSLANAFFVRDSFKDAVKQEYIDTLVSKYNADVIYDAFTSNEVINKWVKDKTLGLIDNLVDNPSELDFVLANALAIDMEWTNQIRAVDKDYRVSFKHEHYDMYLSSLVESGYSSLNFNNDNMKAKSVRIGAIANKYDIVSALGEDAIRNNIKEKYSEWLKSDEAATCSVDQGDVDTYVNKYIEDIKSNYNHISSSTDFKFYNDDNVRVFAKDLKEYDGTTLQYVGIMPKNVSLDSYISNIKASDIKNIISNLKDIELDSFNDNVITEISGSIPFFKFNYKIDLINDFKTLGITDVFDSSKVNLSKMLNGNATIVSAEHSANIDFSNDGIKAGAAIQTGGKGASSCGFDYLYEVPVEKIDLTFDKPYMFIIKDKDSGEVWFAGTVYEPTVYTGRTD